MSSRKANSHFGAPLVPSSQSPSPSEVLDGEDHNSSQLGVLVVDDSDLMRVMIRLALERGGFRVWLAESGSEAIDTYRREGSRISAVLLDVLMPGLSGPQTLEALIQLDPNVRACFVSGDTGDYTPADLVRYGARAVFYKPFRLIDLAEAVRRLALGEPQPEPAERDSELRGAAVYFSPCIGPMFATTTWPSGDSEP